MDISKRGTQTSSLKNVIQALIIGNRSGILLVTSDQTALPQEGRIVFIRGTITDARLGNVTGRRALHALLQWSKCTFIFTEVDTTTEPQQTSLPPSSTTNPLPPPTIPTIPSHQTQPLPRYELPHDWRFNPANPPNPPTPLPPSPPPHPTIPRRLGRDAEGLQRLNYAKLSRTHMHLFLLINGERNIHELAQLLHRSEPDIERLLFDLKKFGIIQF
jgi:hypothetical protein